MAIDIQTIKDEKIAKTFHMGKLAHRDCGAWRQVSALALPKRDAHEG
jgi:hypothetical protein